MAAPSAEQPSWRRLLGAARPLVGREPSADAARPAPATSYPLAMSWASLVRTIRLSMIAMIDEQHM